MVNNWRPRPLHDSGKFKRTLQEAFGPYTDHTIYPTERRSMKLALLRTGIAGAVLGLAVGGLYGWLA